MALPTFPAMISSVFGIGTAAAIGPFGGDCNKKIGGRNAPRFEAKIFSIQLARLVENAVADTELADIAVKFLRK